MTTGRHRRRACPPRPSGSRRSWPRPAWAAGGPASRLIADGRVTVNGVVAQLGQRADGARDLIAVDGIPVPGRQGLAYYLVNKPAGRHMYRLGPPGPA